jgi:hypothetical protein
MRRNILTVAPVHANGVVREAGSVLVVPRRSSARCSVVTWSSATSSCRRCSVVDG